MLTARPDRATPEPGQLPWLPAVPTTLATHARWAPYLTVRAGPVSDLADRTRRDAHSSVPQLGAAASPRPAMFAAIQPPVSAHIPPT